ncbi:MAG: hypothetical protein KGV59_06375 [Tenacibaculum sp.]|nr:hypothetical protein [Tenacibaculum sp.]
MKKVSVFLLMAVIAFVGCKPANKKEVKKEGKIEKVEKWDKQFSYLRMNGIFVMKQSEPETLNDPRNFSKLILSTSEKKGTITEMTFFSHEDINKQLAKCGYQFIGSRPDPHYYPPSKTSIWDVFEKVKDFEGDCSKFKYVISRSPHDNPRHMHLRYGNNVEELLNMSKDKKDDKFNPWWADYEEKNN